MHKTWISFKSCWGCSKERETDESKRKKSIACSTCILNLAEFIVSSIFFGFHYYKRDEVRKCLDHKARSMLTMNWEPEKCLWNQNWNNLLEVFMIDTYNRCTIHPHRHDICKTKQILIQKSNYHQDNGLVSIITQMYSLLFCRHFERVLLTFPRWSPCNHLLSVRITVGCHHTKF